MAIYRNKTKGNGVAKAIAIVLALLIFFVGGGVLGWFASAGNWFGAKDPQKEDGGLIVTESEAHGVKMETRKISLAEYEEYGVAPQADSAYTVTATVKDMDETAWDYLQAVEYSLAWESENSEVLSDYVTLQQSEMQATVTCLKPFSVKIHLKCKSTLNPSISATVTLDYLKRLDGINAKIDGSSSTLRNGSVVNIEMPSFDSVPDSVENATINLPYFAVNRFDFSESGNFGTGTLEGELIFTSYYMFFTDAFRSQSATYLKSFIKYEVSLVSGGMSEVPNNKVTPNIFMFFETTIHGSAPNVFLTNKTIRYEVYNALKAIPNQMNLTVNYTYNGVSGSATYTINFTNIRMPAVESITFDKTNIIF